MKLYELKSLVEDIVFEEINKDQLASTAKALGLPIEELKKWVEETDPTSNKSFSTWLLRELKKRRVRLEDNRRITNDINRFIEPRNARRIEDIMHFPTIHDLETRLDQLAGQGSKRQGFAGIDPSTLPGVSVAESRPDITFYKVTNPDSLAKMGEGTKWCTRFSYNNSSQVAKNYLERYPYLVIGYKDGKPYVQYNPDYSQVMDVNDQTFHIQNPEQAKLLNLPRPNVVVPPVRKRPVRGGLTPAEQKLLQWSKYTTEPVILPSDAKGRDEDYERRVAQAIMKSNDVSYLIRILCVFDQYAQMFLKGKRSPAFENAIVSKDWTKSIQGKAPKAGGNKYYGKRSKYPGFDSIVSYVKNSIGGHWREFEEKIKNNVPLSIMYYMGTGLNPDYTDNPYVKDIILFSKFIKDKHPSVSTSEFEKSIRDFILRSRSNLKYGAFSPVLYKVLLPYMKLSKKPLESIVGTKLAKELMRNASFSREVGDLNYS